MDTPIFPTGAFGLDDLPQVCSLCGMLFNNAISLQHHMQLHILSAAASANQLLANQPPDPGIALTAAPNILDLVAGASQHVIPVTGSQHPAVVVPGSSSSNLIMANGQLFTANSIANMPTHLISHSVGSSSIHSSSLPQKSSKEKKSKSSTKSSSHSQAGNHSTSTSSSGRNSSRNQSSSRSSRQPPPRVTTTESTYISTFPADLQKIDLTPPAKPKPQKSSSKEDLEPFMPTLSQIDPIEEALKVPAFSKVSQFDRLGSSSSTVLSSSSHATPTKETTKLFQPFVTVEDPAGLAFMSKSNTLFTADSLLSPVKTGPDKPPVDHDVLSTPQKPSYSSLQANDNSLSSSPKPLPTVPQSSELRQFARTKSQDQPDFSHFEKLKDRPAVKVSQSGGDSNSSKPPFFNPGTMDPLNISPKSFNRDNKSEKGSAKVLQVPTYTSTSPELKTSISVASEPPGTAKDPTAPMLSPKVSSDISSTSGAPNVATSASKPPLFGGSEEGSSGAPPVYGSSKAGAAQSSSSMNPAVGMTDVTNPLGTGYFNALTQKLLNPGISISTDFNKPNTSSFNYGSDSQGQKGKSYYENGILINQDYDKISESNDSQDLEKLIDDIDPKDDNIDSKGYSACSEIEDILNEFNEKHPEDLAKNKSQMDEFLNDVLNENIRMKLDDRTEDPVVPSAEDMAMNQLAISELLEMEKEKIDKESKMLETQRLNATSVDDSEAGDDDQALGEGSSSCCEVGTLKSANSTTANTTAVTTSVTTATSSTSQTATTDAASTATKPNTKEDDPADFDIPKVGKLMKIRKYFQIQEQKKKEKTRVEEPHAEVKIQIREKEAEKEKPQTILVQVSKRKKIEYGPYINRQSLLEGKPKEQEPEVPPPKAAVFRPKPKPPQIDTKRTFNLRQRKTKTDFATLANKGSRTAEGKKTSDKPGDDKSKPTSGDEEGIEDDKKSESKEEELDESGSTETSITTRNKESGETGISTRNKDKAKKEEDTSQTQKGINMRKGKDNQNKPDGEKESKKEDGKPNLRVRPNKAESNDSANDSKNLRKRTTTTPAESSKSKVQKTDAKTTKADDEKAQKTPDRAGRLNLRNKDTKDNKGVKQSPEKAEIKMCSVNLGENLTESKIKAANCKKGKYRQASKSKNVDEQQTTDDADEKQSQIESNTMEVKDLDKEQTGKTEVKSSDVNGENASSESVKVEKDSHRTDSNTENIKQSDVDIVDVENGPENTESVSNTVNTSNIQTISTDSKSESKTAEVLEDKNLQEESKTVGNPEPEKPKQEPVREKITMKFKLGLSTTTIMKEIRPKHKKRKLGHSKKDKSKSHTPKEKHLKLDIGTGSPKVEATEASEPIKVEPKLEESVVALPLADESLALEKPKVEKSVVGSEKFKFEDSSFARSEKFKFEDSSFARSEKFKFEDSSFARSDSPDGAVIEVEPAVKVDKKPKHSVENEFQRLVDEAMAEAKKAQNDEAGESGKKERYTNLRKRLNEGVKYNVDESDEEIDPKTEFYLQQARNIERIRKFGPKGVPVKMPPVTAGVSRLLNKSPVSDSKPKKDMDIYDFDSDTEDPPPSTMLSFKPKYVSNLKLFGQNKLPFVSKPITPPSTGNTDSETKVEAEIRTETEEEEDPGISYVGLSVEPLKIKLTKITSHEKKKHKHKKKKRKRDKDRKHLHSSDGHKMDFAGSDSEMKGDENKFTHLMTVDSDSNDGEYPADILSAGYSPSLEGRNVAKKPKLKEKKHICEFCNQGFGQKCDLRKHVMIHTGERPWPCGICDKRFQRKTDLVKHTRTHTGEKPYACEFCDKRVSDKSQLSVHRRLHTGDRPYQCTKCGKRCITSSELTRHRAVRCSDKPYPCALCRKTFKIKECLGMHMKMHYRSKGKLFHCDKCAVGFDKKADMDAHSCAIWNNSNYICSECFEEFSDELVYAEHIKTHDLGVFACNMCTKMFEDKHSLETHLCSMVIERQQPISCDICDELFQDQNALSQHIPVHDNDVGSFMCELCPEMFSVRRDFLAHVKTHKEPMESAGTEENIGGRFSGNLPKDGKHLNVIDVDSLEYGSMENVRPGSARMERGFVERASVISKTFRQVDNVSNRGFHSAVTGNGAVGGRMGKTALKSDVLNSDKIFEASDFTNSPDFSSLTDEPDLSMNPFEKLEPQAPGMSRKVNASFTSADNQRENIGFGGSLGHSMKDEEKGGGKFYLGGAAATSLPSPSDAAQTSQEYAWPGSYQISANEYVDSLLKMGPGHSPSDSIPKTSPAKTENHESGVSKSSGILSPSSRGDLYKDNIENRSKTDFFSEFDFQIGTKSEASFPGPAQNKTQVQQKFSHSGARENTAFQGLDQNSFNMSRNRHFPETSPFSNSFMTSFQQNNSIYNSGNTNLFGSGGSDLIQKRGTSSSIFSGNQDMLQSNFYLGVEESLKGTSPSDKTDETTALLSNFDYGIN